MSDKEGDDQLRREAKEAKAKLKRYRAYLARLKKQGKAPSATPAPELKSPDERLVERDLFEVERHESTLRVGLAAKLLFFGKASGLHSTYDVVVRNELKFVVERHEIRVETVSDGEKRLRADTTELGPFRWGVGWSALVKMIQFTVGCHLPTERVATMFGGKFSGPQIGRWLRKVAEWFIAIYLELAAQLAQAEYMSLDDSPTLVLEMRRKLQNGIAGTETEADLDPLVAETAALLGRAHQKVTSSEVKRVVQVSLVTGATLVGDPRSTINFYRTHYGDSGNLLSHLLAMRRRKYRSLKIQGDLSPRNLPNPLYQKTFDIEVYGCAAHARRAIWRHKDDDDELCDFMLKAFAMLARVEARIDELGRTAETTLRLRRRGSRRIWDKIVGRAKSVVNATCQADCKGHRLWPPSSALRKACRYIVRHEKKLTRYIGNPYMAETNNRVERLLRAEVMTLTGCKFRQTEGGRVVFDILRTIVMTCRAAEIPLIDYIRYAYKHRADTAKHPERYTPYAYRLHLDRQQGEGLKAG